MEQLLTYHQAAKLLGLKPGTLYALVSQHKIPFIRLGPRIVRFSRAVLEDWVNSRTVDPRNEDSLGAQ